MIQRHTTSGLCTMYVNTSKPHRARLRTMHLRAHTPLPQCYRQNELQKKRAYDQRVREIEHGSFSPLVFSTTGGMGTTATTVYKRIASMIASKHNKTYSKTIHWLRCRLSFSLIRSAIMCLRGSRSTLHHPGVNFDNINLALSEGRVSSCQ